MVLDKKKYYDYIIEYSKKKFLFFSLALFCFFRWLAFEWLWLEFHDHKSFDDVTSHHDKKDKRDVLVRDNNKKIEGVVQKKISQTSTHNTSTSKTNKTHSQHHQKHTLQTSQSIE